MGRCVTNAILRQNKIFKVGLSQTYNSTWQNKLNDLHTVSRQIQAIYANYFYYFYDS